MPDPNKAVEQMQSEFSAGFQAGAASRDAEIQRLQFALADSEALELGTAERCDQLRAHINALRDALQTFIDEHEECQDADEWMAELCSIEALHVADEALATTPEQSLAAYRDAEIAELKEDLHFQACLTKYLMPYQERAVLAEKERDQLRAQINVLRETLDKACIRIEENGFEIGEHWKTGRQALAATLEQSLSGFKNKAIEAFVNEFSRHVGGDGEFWLHELQDFAMKEQP